MYKNIIIVLLLLCCLILAFTGHSERNARENREISAADYGGLISLRDVLTPEEYQKEVLPFLQKAQTEGAMTYRQLNELSAHLHDMEKKTLAAAEKNRPQEELLRLWENARQGANNLGSQLGRNMGEALDGLSQLLDETTRPRSTPPSEPKTPGEPKKPATSAQI